MAKKTDKPQSRLERLTARMVDAQNRVTEIEDKHEEVFEEWRELNSQIEGFIEQIKIEARKEAVEGETNVLVQSPDVMVSVVGKKRPVFYDFEVAKKKWKHSVLVTCQVRALDPKIVQKLIDDQELSLKEIDGVRKLGDLPTPAVSVKLTKRG